MFLLRQKAVITNLSSDLQLHGWTVFADSCPSRPS